MSNSAIRVKKKNNHSVTEISDTLILPNNQPAIEPKKIEAQPLAPKPTLTKEKTESPAEPQNKTQSSYKKKSQSTPSIKDALSSLNKQVPGIKTNVENIEEETEDSDEHEITETEESVFTEEALRKYFERFVESLRNSDQRMYSALKNQELPITTENTIELQFRNNAQIETFKTNIKPALLNTLRKNLNNQSIEILEKVNEVEETPQAKHYTDKDKLNYLAEKNPSIKKLFQDFNLDFE